MNHLWRARFCVAATAVAVFAGIAQLALPARGGEPIVIPGNKGRVAPEVPEKKLVPRDVFRFGDNIAAPPSFDVLTIPIVPSATPLDPREQKRRKLERLERENWMMVAPGELQAEEDEKNFFNVRDYSPDGLEKADETGNLMFRKLKDDPTAPRMPGQFRSSQEKGKGPLSHLLRREAQEKEEKEEEEETRRQATREDSKQGAHIANELNLKKMFEPREGGDSLAPKFNKSDLTLQGLLSGGASPEALKERRESREEFQRFLNRNSATPLAGPSDPINQRNDLTRQPFNPTLPEPFGAGTLGGSASFGAPATPRPPSAGSLPNAFAGSAAQAGFSAGPLITPRPEPRGPAKPTLKFDPPRRKF